MYLAPVPCSSSASCFFLQAEDERSRLFIIQPVDSLHRLHDIVPEVPCGVVSVHLTRFSGVFYFPKKLEGRATVGRVFSHASLHNGY